MAAEDQVESVASRKFGGVPVWVWGAIVAAVILGVMWWRNAHATQAATATDTTVPDPTMGGTIDPNTGLPVTPYYGSYGGSPGYGYGVGSGYGAGYGYGYPTSNGITTNAQWIQQAEYAAASLGHSQLEILGALTAWLTGQSLTATQQQIVNAAIGLIGLPPDTSGTVPSSTTPPPAAAPPAAKAMTVSITPSGSLPTTTGGKLTIIVQWANGVAGTNAFWVEESSALSSNQWTIVHTFYEAKASGSAAVTVGLNTKGTSSIRVKSVVSPAVSNVITVNLAAPKVPSTPKTGTTNHTVAKKAAVTPTASIVRKP